MKGKEVVVAHPGVEDQRRLAAAMKRGLEADGFAVDVPSDREEGLWLTREQPYDAIVLDILKPKLNRDSVLTRLPTRAVGGRRPSRSAPRGVRPTGVPDATGHQEVSKADLLGHVWDYGYDGDNNIVEVYVRYVRRKIDTPFGCQAIETVRGVGYRFHGDGG